MNMQRAKRFGTLRRCSRCNSFAYCAKFANSLNTQTHCGCRSSGGACIFPLATDRMGMHLRSFETHAHAFDRNSEWRRSNAKWANWQKFIENEFFVRRNEAISIFQDSSECSTSHIMFNRLRCGFFVVGLFSFGRTTLLQRQQIYVHA